MLIFIGETDNQRMARICLVAMNAINKDLQFTIETQEEFEKERLPTLDFEMWLEEGGEIHHSFFHTSFQGTGPYR